MGVHPNVSFLKFPKQGDHLGMRVQVSFHFLFDEEVSLVGEIVRHDVEEPGLEIIRLEDGRFVLATECHYQLQFPTKRGTPP